MKKVISLLMALGMIFLVAGIASADLNDGLVAYYPFNGNADDASGNGNHGTVHGATLIDDRFGNFDSAYSFDGVDDYIDIGNGVKPPFPVTVSVWVKNEESTYTSLFRNDQWDDGSYRYGLATVISGSGHLQARYFEGFSIANNRIGYYSDDPVGFLGEWHHYVVVFAGHLDVHLYWDGVEVLGSYNGSGSGMSYSGSNGALAHFKAPNSVNTWMNGDLDDIRVYARALSEQEIQELYNEGNTKLTISPPSADYLTTQGFDLTLIVEAQGLSVTGGSATLDGSDVTDTLASCIIPGTLVSGGQTFRCPGLTGGGLDTGTHTLDVTLDLSDGSSVSDTINWEVMENTEP